MDLGRRIADRGDQLTAAERRAAETVLEQPELVAFGTVAELATAAGTSGATIVRLAVKLGLDGFTALQTEVQQELGRRLRPAAERIRQPGPNDVVGGTLAVELANVRATLEAIDAVAFDTAVTALADGRRAVHILAGEASRGVAEQASLELAMLRNHVHRLGGSEISVLQSLALAGPQDVCLVIDLKRYERWVLDATEQAARHGLFLIALTDSPLSPLARRADASFVVTAAGAGPFDSHVGTLALLNALVTAVAARHKAAATERLDRLETVWSTNDALSDP